jgi:hypothetical protein
VTGAGDLIVLDAVHDAAGVGAAGTECLEAIRLGLGNQNGQHGVNFEFCATTNWNLGCQAK